MKYTLQNYTLRYLLFALLGIIALWATLFYAYITEEIYDNIDDGLKDTRIKIIRASYQDPNILTTTQFNLNQYRITPLPQGSYSYEISFSNTSVYMEYDEDYEPMRLLTTIFRDIDNNPYKLEIRASTIEEDELIEDMAIALIILYIMLVISIIISNRMVLRKAWKSFYSLLNQLKLYEVGKPETKIEFDNTDIKEFHDLSIELKKMTERNDTLFLQQKRFIENASHEMQTPLSILINRIELFIEDHQLNESQLSEMSDINKTLHRINQLNKSLLLLSKIENKQYIENEAVNFNRIVHDIIDELSPIFEHRNIKINILEHAEFITQMNKNLASILIANLIKNAFRHSSENATVTIDMSSQKISIKNSGNGVALDEEKIFQRFYKSTSENQSVGLGLAIVKSIVSNYPYISLKYRYESGHIFEISK